jgi:hypothetical protein
MSKSIIAGLALAVLAAFPLPGLAQETTGTIVGTVTDQSGAVLPGVTVTLKHVNTGRTFEFVTTPTGTYSATLLPIGNYEITFTLTGFQPAAVTGIQLHVNDRQEISPKLQISGVTEVVQVTAETQFVQPTPAVQNLVDSKRTGATSTTQLRAATLSPGVSSDLPDEVKIA